MAYEAFAGRMEAYERDVTVTMISNGVFFKLYVSGAIGTFHGVPRVRSWHARRVHYRAHPRKCNLVLR